MYTLHMKDTKVAQLYKTEIVNHAKGVADKSKGRTPWIPILCSLK